ncbi:MAG: DNA-directed RNA polymerase subunit H [Candidatus Aenigmarchaeota archaeon]
MGVDILKHQLVPKHEILSASEKKEILEKLGITPRKLPFVKADDPVAKALEAKAGDILRISRKSHTAGSSVYYRIVV